MKTIITYKQAIKHFGSPSELARALGIKPQAIYQWDNKIPRLRQYEIAEIMRVDSKSEALPGAD